MDVRQNQSFSHREGFDGPTALAPCGLRADCASRSTSVERQWQQEWLCEKVTQAVVRPSGQRYEASKGLPSRIAVSESPWSERSSSSTANNAIRRMEAARWRRRSLL